MNTPAPRRTILLGSLLVLTGCETGFADAPVAPGSALRGPNRDLADLSYRAIERLVETTPDLTENVPVVVASITDSRRLDESSRFGTIIADLARSRLSQLRIPVSEQRLRTAMALRPNNGEMMLSRDPRAIVAGPMHSCILTGTYAAAEERVYVALKLIRASDARILNSVDFVVWRNGDVNQLLADAFPV
jgi:TolB-like protein